LLLRPYLKFPEVLIDDRQQASGFKPETKHPDRDHQINKFDGPMRELKRTMESRLASLRSDSPGIDPEMVLVLETACSIRDFYTAVKNTEGFSWLLETVLEDILEDEEFYLGDEPSGKKLDGRLYLLLTNRTALENLLTLWERYKNNQGPGYGKTKWRELFTYLKEIRPWDARDRIAETGLIEQWEEELSVRNDTLSFEMEFWFKDDERQRKLIEESVIKLLEDFAGKFITSSVIPEINYHGLLANIPAANAKSMIDSVKEEEYNKLLKCEYVRYFNPLPQSDLMIDYDNLPEEEADFVSVEKIEAEPVIALFDGLPLPNHKNLLSRLIIDDPEGFSEDYPAKARLHGTAMASIILNGDLNCPNYIANRRIYVRPILKPGKPTPISNNRQEIIPEDQLLVDLVYKAVERLFVRNEQRPAMAPGIKVINLAIGDVNRPFIRQMSSLARLLDWLSWKYKVLFIISAGNYDREIILEDKEGSNNHLAESTVKQINKNLIDRRIISPAESINSITVGAEHDDKSDFADEEFPYVFDLLPGISNMPSPISRFGLGFNRSIKPDILLPGGKQVYNKLISTEGQGASYEINNSVLSPPGIKVAYPGAEPNLSSAAFSAGTSNAAAMATHKAWEIYDLIEENRDIFNFPEDLTAVLIKTLLVHYADWRNAREMLANIIEDEVEIDSFRRHAQKFLGYGFISPDQQLGCTDRQATLIAAAKIEPENGHKYIFPLPQSLIGRALLKRMVITLSWFTPINPGFNNYRLAKLYFDPPSNSPLEISRKQANHLAAQRGTIQHEVLTGKRASVYREGENIVLWVNYLDRSNNRSEERNNQSKSRNNHSEDRNNQSEKNFKVPYALALTLDLPESSSINIYDEIKDRIEIIERERIRIK